jgi:hypothetical protein
MDSATLAVLETEAVEVLPSREVMSPIRLNFNLIRARNTTVAAQVLTNRSINAAVGTQVITVLN